MSETTFADLKLAAPILDALAEKNYTIPSPIQAQAIPVLLEGKDLLACAQTGTGKTAAFALPTLHKLATQPGRAPKKGVRCLILTPTRELAVQIADNFKLYGKNIRFRHGMVFGGVSQNPQVRSLAGGLDVLVATTGRLCDLMQQGFVDLSSVETLILDEADRMLDMGFIRDIRTITAAIPKKRQTLLFSATMAPEITKLAAGLLKDPEEIRIVPEGTTAEKVNQSVMFVSNENKKELLIDLLRKHQAENKKELCLVFNRTKHGAKKLAEQLNKAGIPADSIHGNKSQNARQRALENFRTGQSPVLVATDVAARGIDVKNITLVVNYDLPMEAPAYVHRIGRTARAGASGIAIAFCCKEEVFLLREVEKLIKGTVTVDADQDYHEASVESLHKSGVRVPKPANGGRQQGGGGRGRSGGNRGGGGGGFSRGGGARSGGPSHTSGSRRRTSRGR